MAEARSVKLHYREGSSDKVYEARLEEEAGGWAVRFAYGRRGKPLTRGEKGAGLSFAAAEKVYDKLVASKIAKGYTEDERGAAFSSAAMAGRATEFRPQLLNEISEAEAWSLGADWLVQEKHDGERRGMLWDGERAVFANRRGLETAVDARIAEAFERLARMVGGRLALDAEDMGDHVVIFDVIEHVMVREGTFRERAAILGHLAKTIGDHGLGAALRVDVPTPADRFFAEHAGPMKARGAEGFVLRRAEALYAPGRPASGGEALKVKHWAEATCRVAAGREGRRSIGLELRDGIDGPWIPVGNVTVPANLEVPAPGALVEVRYLYAHEGGSLFQPVLKGPRTDVTEEAAQMAQLKIKTAPEDVRSSAASRDEASVFPPEP